MSNPALNFFQEYWIDAWQRSIRRSTCCASAATPISSKGPDGAARAHLRVRGGARRPHPAQPVNYVLVRIVPPPIP